MLENTSSAHTYCQFNADKCDVIKSGILLRTKSQNVASQPVQPYQESVHVKLCVCVAFVHTQMIWMRIVPLIAWPLSLSRSLYVIQRESTDISETHKLKTKQKKNWTSEKELEAEKRKREENRKMRFQTRRNSNDIDKKNKIIRFRKNFQRLWTFRNRSQSNWNTHTHTYFKWINIKCTLKRADLCVCARARTLCFFCFFLE